MASLAFDLVLALDPATLVPAPSINVLVNKQYIHESFSRSVYLGREHRFGIDSHPV